MEADRPVTLAAVAGAHGVKGEVRLKLFGEGVAALKHYQCFGVGGRNTGLATLTVLALREDGKGGAIARFTEVTDRAAAEALRGQTLHVPRNAMPPLAPGEYYHADLIGLVVVSEAGEALGMVVAVENFGAGDILEIERPNNERPNNERPNNERPARFMVPMRAEAVITWNDAHVVINAAYAGE